MHREKSGRQGGLDLSETNHQRLERPAKEGVLNRASYARQAVSE